MQNSQQSLFSRSDTIFGVCEGIGEDFGFNAQILRVGLALAGFWNPAVALGVYAALGLAVLLSRKLFPNPAAVEAVAADGVAGRVALSGVNDEQPVELAVAA